MRCALIIIKWQIMLNGPFCVPSRWSTPSQAPLSACRSLLGLCQRQLHRRELPSFLCGFIPWPLLIPQLCLSCLYQLSFVAFDRSFRTQLHVPSWVLWAFCYSEMSFSDAHTVALWIGALKCGGSGVRFYLWGSISSEQRVPLHCSWSRYKMADPFIYFQMIWPVEWMCQRASPVPAALRPAAISWQVCLMDQTPWVVISTQVEFS